ncbi:hypothetical protein LPJ66_006155 [Kickxella alabastrina]|uniref:Uncharacterized protein n=1 Tax=Kickxella alabastrina TaxID=61397 RepID=A0ACC1ICD8_9FUNG|nr:hypothetical protein LPJ66_006155 [Kickxella alabastrina]
MAHPLARTALQTGDKAGVSVALGAWLGESLFARIHPEDVVRVVRALRLVWDARPDAYHYARLRRQWQRAADLAPPPPPPVLRQVLRADGIEVANGVAELNVQVRLGGSADLDWADAEACAAHTRFARVKLARWPLVLRPPRSSAAGEPQDGFVLVAMRPLPEPSGARAAAAAAGITRFEQGAAELGRSLSGLSLAAAEEGAARAPAPIAIHTQPRPRPQPQRRRRSNIAVGSMRADAECSLFGTPREMD